MINVDQRAVPPAPTFYGMLRFMKHLMLLTLLLSLLALPAEAQMRGRGRMGDGGKSTAETQSGPVERREQNIQATGLVPAFPPGMACEPVASPYGSPTRYDGSTRRMDRNGGLHGGLDLTLNTGTPLLAVAAGEIIHKGEGGQLEGIYLWLRHAPEDTGLPFWTFTKYQHLSTLPTLAVGTRVQAGQPVALSGGTGTAGGHYGAAGYPHLHLSTQYGPSPEYQAMGMFGSMIKGQDGQSGDPMILYLKDIASLADVRALQEEKRQIAVPVVDPDGLVQLTGSKTVWPVACRRE